VCAEAVTSSGVTMVTCNVTVNASNIHKPLEALEVRPVIVNHTAAGNDTAPCSESGWSADVVDSSSESTQSRLFVLVVNVTGLATGTCLAPSLTLHATTLSGKLVSTIKDRPPEYKLLLPVSSQGTYTLCVSCMSLASLVYVCADRSQALVTRVCTTQRSYA